MKFLSIFGLNSNVTKSNNLKLLEPSCRKNENFEKLRNENEKMRKMRKMRMRKMRKNENENF